MKQLNVRLDDEIISTLDKHADRFGGKAQAVAAAIRALDSVPNSTPAPAAPAAPAQSIDLPTALEEAAKRLRSLERIARFVKP